MTEEAWINYWREVMANTYIDSWEGERGLPSKDHLDALETKLGFLLPISYRGFVRVFGPGRIARSFTVFVPGFPHAPRVDFPDREGWQFLVEPNPERTSLVSSLVVFGDFHGHNGIFVWHRDQSTDIANREYQIFYLPRPATEPLIPISRSFSGLITEDFFQSAFFPKYGVPLSEVELEWVDEESGETRTRKCFDPIGFSVCPVDADPTERRTWG